MPSKIQFSQKQIAIMTISLSFILALVTSLVVANMVHSSQTNSSHEMTKSSQKLMVHISSGVDEPHAIMMGLNKALKAREAGLDVFVYADVKATDIMLAKTDIAFADFPSSQKLVNQLIDSGAQVYVCPHCLMVNGGKMNEVIPGVRELTMDNMISFMNEGGVTALDY